MSKKQKPTNPNGCYDRPPLKKTLVVFDGYHDAARTKPKTRRVKVDFKPGCQYSLTTADPRCAGCKHERKA